MVGKGEGMNSLERVRRAVHFRGPDRVPHCLPDGEPNDLLMLPLPEPQTGRAGAWREVGGGRWRRTDEWGSIRVYATGFISRRARQKTGGHRG